MASPSVNGLTLLIDVSSAAITAPNFPGVSLVANTSTNGYLFLNEVDAVANTEYGVRFAFVARSFAGKGVTLSWGVGQTNRIADAGTQGQAAGLMFAAEDENGNFRRWVFAANDTDIDGLRSIGLGNFKYVTGAYIELDFTNTAQTNDAGFDVTKVIGLEIHAKTFDFGDSRQMTLTFGDFFEVDAAIGPEIVGGELNDMAGLAELSDLEAVAADNERPFISRVLERRKFELLTSLTISADQFYEIGGLVLFAPLADFAGETKDLRVHAGQRRLAITQSGQGDISPDFTTFEGAEGVSFVTSGSLDFKGISLLSFKDIELNSSFSGSGGVVQGYDVLTLNGAELLGVSLVGAPGDIVLTSLGPTNRFTVQDTDVIRIDDSASDLSALVAELEGGTVVEFNEATNPVKDLTGLTNISGVIEFDNLTTDSITVTVDSSLSFTIADPTTGGGALAVAAPTDSMTISGLPNVANAILAVTNLNTLSTAYPALAAGSATFTVDPTANYRVRAKAPGYSLEVVTLPGITKAFTISLSSFRDIYDAGINRSADIAFDFLTLEVLVNDGTAELVFNDVYRTIEDYLSTPQGVMFDFPPVPVVVELGGGNKRNYLFFPYDDVADGPNPVRIKPNPANTSDPTLVDFVIVLVGSAFPVFDIFDFSAANGRTLRAQTDSVVSSGQFGDTQLNQLNNLAALLSSPGSFTPEAFANVELSGGEFGTAQSNQLSQLASALSAPGVFSAASLRNAIPEEIASADSQASILNLLLSLLKGKYVRRTNAQGEYTGIADHYNSDGSIAVTFEERDRFGNLATGTETEIASRTPQ